MSLEPPKLSRIRFFGPGVAEENPSKEVLGGKGHSLTTMTRAGLPVPPGFIIPTDCCGEYYAAGKKWPAGLEDEIRQALAWLEAVTGRKLGQAPLPLTVAVRSGAAVSMPGMMDTVLNVGLRPELEGCWRDFRKDYADFVRQYGEIVAGLDERIFEEGDPVEAFRKATGREFPRDPWELLTSAVTAVFNSWENERALRYRAHHNIRGLRGTAAVVQAMFPSQRSGILFTEDPNRPDEGRLLIEASSGLGEAIVRGHVEPDVYCLDRKSLEVRERKLTGSAPLLDEKQVLDLARLGLKVEEHYGTPVDVEWGIADGRIVLLQGRPVRGLDVVRAVPRAREEEIARLRKLAEGRPKAAWALHNLGETLAAPTPLTWDVIGRAFMGGGFLRLYRDLGFRPSERVLRDGFLELIAGRIYADVERAGELFFGPFPMEYDLDSGRPAAEVLLDRPTKFNVERAGLGFLLKLPWTIALMVRAGRVMKRALRTGLDDLKSRVLPRFAKFAEEGRSKDLRTLSDEEVLREIERRIEEGLNGFGPESLKPGFLAGYHHGRLASTLEQVLGTAEGRAVTARLLGGLEGDKTVECNIALYQVAGRELSLEKFLAEYGHRAVNELELAEPRWSEDPSYPRQRIAQYRAAGGASPLELHKKKKREREEAERALGKILRENGAGSLEEEVRRDLAGAQLYMPWRETCKHYFILAVALVREGLEVLAERWDLGKDLYFLERRELAAPREARERIAERKLRWQALQRLPVPEVLRASDLEALGREEERAASADGLFTGTAVASGVGTGTARVLRSPSEAGDLTTGYVLVCPTTDPSWTPLFVHASGLVVERGGMLSHGAIVARDFGIPAVVLPQATRLIPDGAQVKIDGNRGRVEILRPAHVTV